MLRIVGFFIILITCSLQNVHTEEPFFESLELASDKGVDESASQKDLYKSFEEKSDLSIERALVLNEQGKKVQALKFLREAVTETNFKNVKLRYFLAKQYLLVMKSNKTALKNKDYQSNLRYHVSFVEEFVNSEECNAEDAEYYTLGLKTLKEKQDRLFNVDRSHTSKKFSYKSLKKAATDAYNVWPGTSGKCYPVSVLTARNNGSTGDGWSWKSSQKYRWKSMSSIDEAILDNSLKPGMVIYVNTAPGADPQSLDMSYLPHWFTYLGKDSEGVSRFSDQYTTNSSLKEMINFVPGRLIDAFFDPYN
ncbi:MAG: hypothetical protein KC646_14010 [Candidatus Cloacimonetes bacterium]|nr:hypothetical protein [Candidatus Cloacimonadota bacterium]